MKKAALHIIKILISLALFVVFCVFVMPFGGYCAGPEVSIIIPVYNVDKNLLKNCLDSVKNQTLKNIEIICVDDGSTDGSGLILDEYAKCDSKFKVYHQKNGGPSRARNRGIEMSSGEYIQFVDSDDCISKNMSQKLYNLAKQEDADIVKCGFYSPVSAGKASPGRTRFGSIFGMIGSGYVWDGLYRSRFLKENGLKFDEMSSFAEDISFNMTCFPKAQKTVCCSDKLYCYKYNICSLTHTRNDQKALKSLAQNLNFVYKNWKENGYFENDSAKLKFLKWFLNLGGWLQKDGALGLFMDAIGEELKQDSAIDLLPLKQRLAFRKMKANYLNKSA